MKKITLLGFVCLAVILILMSFAACAQPAAAPVTVTAPPVTVTVTKTPAAPAEPMYTVLDPRSWEPPYPYQGLTPRLSTLEGKKIIVINVRGGNEEAILSVGPALKKAVPSATVDVVTTQEPWMVLAQEWQKFKTYDAAIWGHNY